MTHTRILTGITTTGTPHLGNYVGAIRPAIEASQDSAMETFYFLADFHALIKARDPRVVEQSRLEIAATWLALGLDTNRSTFYRQSDIPEIPELAWLLSCVCAKGLMNRAHAYKAAVADNEEGGSADPDRGITMGLYGYPVLMAADILMFNANRVPVGRDQVQHIEMARDIAGRFNHLYKGQYFTLPEAVIDERVQLLNGLDGRKMSKSYDNTIPLFVSEKKLLKLIRKIKTNSLEPGEPKETEGDTLFQIYQAFADTAETEAMRQRYAEGIGWGDAKNQLFELVNEQLTAPRERYYSLLDDPGHIEQILQQGAEKAREEAAKTLDRLRSAVGLGRFI
ncbi:tryptophan--tRNA ligase [Larsenimonas rhizosphaerae]|uniref:Tryptophan--tRNA ligase n=1 Tax=Larsenimonas rhizosphaerae TaxID=2944682 RepID=A0AA41ZLI2_9GAMM|nr:tryptophan--tRNA ligase [Larsenimonas rhizosphaerae]MCM2129648.1 tryptophan--tRNA ligase [Larsenimonas rhizosphaerae]MCX2524306.1 tryptophan--tRNA ligase [Larsenimonas rhizosphaerae]